MTDLTWPKLVLLTLYALSLASTIYLVGKPRVPITPGSAVVTFVMVLLMCTLVVIA